MGTPMNILTRLKEGIPVPFNDPEYGQINEVVARAIQLSAQLNTLGDVDKIRQKVGEIIGQELDASTTIFAPFYTNFGRHIKIGKNVFINHDVSCVDMGGIVIEDHAMIGPKASLLTENHPLTKHNRRTLITKPIRIKENAWIGGAATILPGVTVGENAIVAAGAVVSKDVAAGTIVAGVPAKKVRDIPE